MDLRSYEHHTNADGSPKYVRYTMTLFPWRSVFDRESYRHCKGGRGKIGLRGFESSFPQTEGERLLFYIFPRYWFSAFYLWWNIQKRPLFGKRITRRALFIIQIENKIPHTSSVNTEINCSGNMVLLRVVSLFRDFNTWRKTLANSSVLPYISLLRFNLQTEGVELRRAIVHSKTWLCCTHSCI